jgi:hypothetical protein
MLVKTVVRGRGLCVMALFRREQKRVSKALRMQATPCTRRRRVMFRPHYSPGLMLPGLFVTQFPTAAFTHRSQPERPTVIALTTPRTRLRLALHDSLIKKLSTYFRTTHFPYLPTTSPYRTLLTTTGRTARSSPTGVATFLKNSPIANPRYWSHSVLLNNHAGSCQRHFSF